MLKVWKEDAFLFYYRSSIQTSVNADGCCPATHGLGTQCRSIRAGNDHYESDKIYSSEIRCICLKNGIRWSRSEYLEAVEAIGFPTINNSRAIRLVRNKAVTAVYAHNHGLPTPLTYFVAQPQLLKQIPMEDYPLVVK